MTKTLRFRLRGVERNGSVVSVLTFVVAVAAAGCSGSEGEGEVGAVGGSNSAIGGATGVSSTPTLGGASGAGTGGSSLVGQTGGASSQTGAGGAVQSLGGATSIGSSTVATTIQGGSQASVGGSSGGKSAGGATGSGGTKASGGSPNGGASAVSGGTTAKGGTTSSGGTTAKGGTTASGGTTAKGGTTSSGGTTSIGGTTAKGGTTGVLPALTIYVAGDSTVSTYANTAATNDQAGWGQMLAAIFSSKVTVVNKAIGGRTAYHFYLEGGVTAILNVIKPGDYFFIQFGTNDQNATATYVYNGVTYPYFADAQTTFKTQLKQYYLDPAKAKGAIPVLVTPPPRNSAYCNGGNGLGGYATAMKELGAVENVAVLDNNLKTFNYLKAICPKPTVAADETFFKNNTGTIDGTHFQENGARKMAGFIGEETSRIALGLSGYLL